MRTVGPQIPQLPQALRQTDKPARDASRAMVAKALAEGRVCIVYQPVVSTRPGAHIAFHEALVRLRTPTGGLLSPWQFLPSVVGTTLAADLDCAVLRCALEELQRRPQARISVNVGADTIDSPGWMNTLMQFTNDQPDIAFRLIVEVTEDPGVLGHPDCPIFLQTLQGMGICLALDDFGAGATGFSEFRKHRFDIVKIDGSFGDGLHRNRDAQVLVSALLQISQHFEMMTVIEYIDNPADAAVATKLGLDCMQGFLFGRPDLCLASRATRSGRDLRGAG